MKLFQKSLIASSLALASVASNAADSNMYGVFGVQRAELDENYSALTNLGVSVDDNDVGYNFAIGYQLNKNFAVELGYIDLGKVASASASASAGGTSGSGTIGNNTYSYTSNAAGSVNANVEAKGFTLAGLFSTEVAQDLDVFAKAGLFNWDADGTASATVTAGTVTVNGTAYTSGTSSIGGSVDGTDFFWGVGASYDIDENMAIRADYTKYKFKAYGAGVDVDSLGAALVVKF